MSSGQSAIASEPYCADAPSRSTSTDFTIAVGIVFRSTAAEPRPMVLLTFTSEAAGAEGGRGVLEPGVHRAQRALDGDHEERHGDERLGDTREAMRIAYEYMARADRSLDNGDVDAALDHLGCAMRELGEVATVEVS